ncbi:MAG: OmpA family protein [Actinomycetota bacterium]
MRPLHRRAVLLRIAGALAAALAAGQSFADPPPALGSVVFAPGTHSLSTEAKAELNKLVAWLKANPDRKVRLAGHSDDPGSDEYNLAIGERRASSVKAYLVACGIAASRLTTVSYGRFRSQPGAGTRNARVDLVIED